MSNLALMTALEEQRVRTGFLTSDFKHFTSADHGSRLVRDGSGLCLLLYLTHQSPIVINASVHEKV